MRIKNIVSIIMIFMLFTTVVYAAEGDSAGTGNDVVVDVETTVDGEEAIDTEVASDAEENKDTTTDVEIETENKTEVEDTSEEAKVYDSEGNEITDPEVLDRIRLHEMRFKGTREISEELLATINEGIHNSTMPIDVIINDRYLDTDVDALIIDNRTYVPFRAVVEAFNFSDVEWNSELYKTTFKAGDIEMELLINTPVVIVNDEEVAMDAPTLIIEGRTMVPIRIISEILGFEVGWDGIYYAVTLNHETYGVNEEKLDNRFYSVDELKTFSKLVYREAGSVSYETKHGVASVVMNQVRNAYLANTIHGVIYAESKLKHFPPAHKDNFQETVPNKESVLAVKKALRGENSAGACLYFNTSPFKGKTIFKVIDGVYFCY